ncbi:MAG: 2-C-methyl-D-erythritol 4-phosphate cytidylyltransferase [Halanaerobiales bacterium]
MSIGAVIPAAGQGKRMKSKINKQFLQLSEHPVLAHTISVFINNNKIDQIILVVHSDELDYCKENIINNFFDQDDQRIKIIAGGKTRRESVYAGLKAFSPAIDYVLIHDGARPLLSQGLLDKVIDSLNSYDAVIVGTRLKDTVKQVDKKGIVQMTPDRSNLMAVQTPQAFLYELIIEAHQAVPADQPVTDDASLLEYMGKKVKIIKGSYENIKITTPMDLIFAEKILEKRRKG